MTTYTNMGHEMATIIFDDGDGFFLKRGERRVDSRPVKWIDRWVKVTETPVVPRLKKEDKDKVLNKE